MLADVNTALHTIPTVSNTIPTVSNTETNELIYIATVILGLYPSATVIQGLLWHLDII